MEHRIIAGALFDFLGYLSTREGILKVGGSEEPTPLLDALAAWAKERGLEIGIAEVQDWQKELDS